ncbi:MAG TPA: Ig-like domain-containing protein, partial [Flavobacterium sp.]|nr:Ig-like domain-containing protein [Flavobacterium sp.]
WSSADENIATVDANGLVTAVGLGNTTISYTVTLETGCATTVTRDVQVYQPIEVLSQPSNIAVTTGSPASFSVVATGSVVGATWEISNDNGFSFEPLTIAPPYSTSFDSGTNTYTLSISSAENEMSGGYYRLYLDAESPCGDAASFSALLNVGSTGIATQPSSVNICSPTTSEVSFTVVPSGPVDSYQWYVDYGFGPFPITDPVDLFYPEISYSNFDTATLTVSGLTTDHNGLVFSVDVVGPLNTVNSNQAVLTVNGSVEITDQPDAAQTCSSGGSTNLSFAYSGSATGVQWQYATSAAGPFGPISNGVPAGFTYNAVGPSLTVDNAAGVATGVHYYRAVIDAASPCTDVITDVASLEVVAPTLVLNTTTASYCTPGPGVTLSVSGAVNYSWSPATGLDTNEGSTVVASPSTTTTYTVTGTDANGCSSTAQVTVNVGPAIQAAATASASLICEGASSTLSANGILSFTPPAVNNYVFSTQTGTSLDPMDGAVTLLGTGFDDTASALANIGFSFNYEGNTYTTFSVTPDGFLKLGTVTTTQFSNSMSSTTNIPKIAAFWDDSATGTNGSVRYVVTGAAPNRVLKVEWFTTIPRNTTGPANSRFQAWLYESNSA